MKTKRDKAPMSTSPLRATRITLPENTRVHSVVLLQEGLVHALDLERQAKQAHWNVRGSNFSALHALFDQVADEDVAHADLCAERLVALGGTADGRVQSLAAKTTTLTPCPASAHQGIKPMATWQALTELSHGTEY
jgi:starvation-inducible DNA-binding protein